MDKDFLTVSDFAERAGVSKQAVYKRLNRDLKPYARTVNGVKYLSASALTLFSGKDGGAAGRGTDQPPDVGGGMTAFLIGQIAEKDKQIAALTAEIKELHQQLARQAEATVDAVNRQSQLQENLQVLLARQLPAPPVISGGEVVETTAQPVEQPAVETDKEKTVTPQGKKGFLSWLKRN